MKKYDFSYIHLLELYISVKKRIMLIGLVVVEIFELVQGVVVVQGAVDDCTGWHGEAASS